jgi:1,4-alpha-glucan branching enzyme
LEVEGVPAAAVCVAGCFNEWSETATPMTALEPGRWSVELSLLPGRYEYLLVVDGQWQTDPRCMQHVPNPYGTENCVLEVLAPA